MSHYEVKFSFTTYSIWAVPHICKLLEQQNLEGQQAFHFSDVIL